MKKYLKFLILAPCLMAVLCEDIDDDVPCGLLDPEPFVAEIETLSATYDVDEPIFIYGETSSLVTNTCNVDAEPDLVTDSSFFRDAIFVLRLKEDSDGFNAEVVENVDVTYIIGEERQPSCVGIIEYNPELSEDNFAYMYRISLAVSEPGDYVIVSANNFVYSAEVANNSEIFETYNTLDNSIIFAGCSNTFFRFGTDDFYFFTIQ